MFKIFWENRFKKLKKPIPVVSVIIAAAGSGLRMGGISKPLSMLCNHTVLSYSLELFDRSEFVKQIIISAKDEDILSIKKLIKSSCLSKPTFVVKGGNTRQESVFNAFKELYKDKKDITPYTAIHDAARPLLTDKQFEEAVRTAFHYGSAVCASKVRDTIKRTDKTGFVTEEIDREQLWQIQTPQIFDTDIFHTSVSLAIKEQTETTDESGLLIKAGFRVKLFECSSENIKLTYPEDFKIAEAILKGRGQ